MVLMPILGCFLLKRKTRSSPYFVRVCELFTTTLFIFFSTATCGPNQYIIHTYNIMSISFIFKALWTGIILYFKYYFCHFLYKIFVLCAQNVHKYQHTLYFLCHIHCITNRLINQCYYLLRNSIYIHQLFQHFPCKRY